MPPFTLIIEPYRRRQYMPPTRHQWRWRARAANGEKLSNGGAAYINAGDLLHALHVQWPDGSDAHVGVRIKPGVVVPLSTADAAWVDVHGR